MPVNSVPRPFDPYDEDRWFYGFMSRADATDLLSKNIEIGAFLVRESTTARGDLVLSVKENDDKVSHYIINRILTTDKSPQVRFRIGEQIFYDIPSLLKFYMVNNLDDTPLEVPAISRDPLIIERGFTKDYLREAQLDAARNNGQSDNNKMVPFSLQRKLPVLAKVIQSRIPNAYDKTALTLREGEIVRVTKVDISGCWEGEISGRKGHFPFNYVKFIEDSNE